MSFTHIGLTLTSVKIPTIMVEVRNSKVFALLICAYYRIIVMIKMNMGIKVSMGIRMVISIKILVNKKMIQKN